MTDLEAMKAAFLAKGGAVKVAPVGIASGVDKDVDKAKRAEARAAARYERTEQEAEQFAESVREAYHTGGRHAAIDAMQPPSHWRY